MWPGAPRSCLSRFALFLSLTTKTDEMETGGQQAGGQERPGGEKETQVEPLLGDTFPESEPQVCKDPRRSGVKTSASDGGLRGRDMPASLVFKGLGLEVEHPGS